MVLIKEMRLLDNRMVELDSVKLYKDNREYFINSNKCETDPNEAYYNRIEELKTYYSIKFKDITLSEKCYVECGGQLLDFETYSIDRCKLMMAYMRGGVDEYYSVKYRMQHAKLEDEDKSAISKTVYIDGLSYLGVPSRTAFKKKFDEVLDGITQMKLDEFLEVENV